MLNNEDLYPKGGEITPRGVGGAIVVILAVIGGINVLLWLENALGLS